MKSHFSNFPYDFKMIHISFSIRYNSSIKSQAALKIRILGLINYPCKNDDSILIPLASKENELLR